MAQLIIVEGPNRGQTFELRDLNTLGRAAENSICLNDRRVSDNHAEIRLRRTGFEIRNLDQKKNLLVNGEVFKQTTLQHGDWITIADTTLVFSEDDQVDDRDQRVLEVRSIDADDLLTSTIQSRRKHFEDAESVIESLDRDHRAEGPLRTLYKVNHQISSILDQKRLVEKLVDIVFEYFEADRAFLMLLDEDLKKLKPVASRVSDRTSLGADGRTEASRTIIKEVFKQKEAVLCTDAQDDARFLSGQSIVEQDIRSFMCVPLVHQGKITGIIQVSSSSDTRVFNGEDLDLLTAIAMQASVAIENSKAYRKRREYNRTLVHLGRETQKLSSYLERDKVLRELVKSACKILGCTKASVLMLQEDGTLKLESAVGLTKDLWAKIDKSELGQRFCRKVLQDNAPKLVTDLTEELGVPANPRYSSSSFLIVPIVSKTGDIDREMKPVGVVCVTDKGGGGAFNGNDQEVLAILASQAGIALANAELYEKATVDVLTRVFVRRHFFQVLDDTIKACLFRTTPLSLLMLDIDHFKHTNDTYGHQGGDAVLRRVGSILKKAVRPEDTVARYGGEEFVIILPTADVQHACRIAERVRRAMEGEPFKVGEQTIHKTISIGVATLDPQDGRDSLVRKADLALYQAKQRGRNRHEVYEGSLGPEGAVAEVT